MCRLVEGYGCAARPNPPGVRLGHGANLVARAHDIVDLTFVPQHAGETAIVPPHEQRALTGLLHDTVPHRALGCGRDARALDSDVLHVADGQHDSRDCAIT